MIVALPFLILAGAASPSTVGDWTYRVPATGEPGEHPLPVALPLSPEVPEDLTLATTFAGSFQRFGQIRYGDADSTRIAVVVDQLALDEAALYVDANRDRRITAGERLERESDTGAGRWIASLAVETDEGGEPRHLPRRVVFQLGAVGGILGYATMGFLEGELTLEERAVAVRRADGDGDGFFTSSRDPLWLDLDGDGRFAPLSELYLFAPILALDDGARYALRSDPLGERFAAEALLGVGRVRVALPRLADSRSEPRALHVLLVGRDGSAVGVEALGAEIELPAGEYRVGMVTCALSDPDGGREWSFVFSEPGGRSDLVWYAVLADGALELDPIGAPELGLGALAERADCAPGDELRVQPRLTTADGLLVNVAYRGLDAPRWGYGASSAHLRLLGPDGDLLDVATSGFA